MDGTISITRSGETCPLPMALPLFSTDTVDEAENLQVLFGVLVPKGDLAGRYVNTEVHRAKGTEASMAEVLRLQEEMGEAYTKMKKG